MGYLDEPGATTSTRGIKKGASHNAEAVHLSSTTTVTWRNEQMGWILAECSYSGRSDRTTRWHVGNNLRLSFLLSHFNSTRSHPGQFPSCLAPPHISDSYQREAHRTSVDSLPHRPWSITLMNVQR